VFRHRRIDAQQDTHGFRIGADRMPGQRQWRARELRCRRARKRHEPGEILACTPMPRCDALPPRQVAKSKINEEEGKSCGRCQGLGVQRTDQGEEVVEEGFGRGMSLARDVYEHLETLLVDLADGRQRVFAVGSMWRAESPDVVGQIFHNPSLVSLFFCFLSILSQIIETSHTGFFPVLPNNPG
jgi:hypothetical protein